VEESGTRLDPEAIALHDAGKINRHRTIGENSQKPLSTGEFIERSIENGGQNCPSFLFL
jgi:hypothetical protein